MVEWFLDEKYVEVQIFLGLNIYLNIFIVNIYIYNYR
jgi:hypothetical protein